MSVLPRDHLKKLLIACDHGGFTLKEELQNALPEFPWQDLGVYSADPVDYPDLADRLCTQIQPNASEWGILICGSGQGMVMRANRYPHIRAALCTSEHLAQLARAHNDANVLCLGGRELDAKTAERILVTFLSTAFEGGRHSGRVQKLGSALKR